MKWVFGSLAFLIMVSIACVFWYRHETAPYKQEAAEVEETVRQWEKDQQAKADSQRTDRGTSETSDTMEPEITEEILDETMDEESETIPTISFDKPAPVRYSPNGLGPYPEVPEEYFWDKGPTTWQMIHLLGLDIAPPSLEAELAERVLLKLWKDGHTNWRSAGMRNGKVYVIYQNQVHIRYSKLRDFNGKVQKNPDGTPKRYISMWLTGGDIPKPTEEQLLSGETPEGFEIIDLDAEDIGIEPYSFLGLEK